METETSVNILWTGGWDSTFRVLDLASKRDARISVHPYYLYDSGRDSTDLEIGAIREIRKQANARPNVFTGSISEPIIYNMDEMRTDSDIHDALLKIKQETKIGWQYYPLACFAKSQELFGIELSAELRGEGSLPRLLSGLTVRQETPTGPVHRVSDKLKGTPEHTVFSPFSFPLFETTKNDMERIAKEKSFIDLMEKTWFCHNPLPNKKPCGCCNPCVFAIKEGFGRRVGRRGLFRYKTRKARYIYWKIFKK